MNMSGESLLIILVVGVVAGWLAGQIVQGTGFGIVGDLIIGVVGAFIGGWLLPQLGIHLGSGIIAAIINPTIGAGILLLIIRLVPGGGAPVSAGGEDMEASMINTGEGGEHFNSTRDNPPNHGTHLGRVG